MYCEYFSHYRICGLFALSKRATAVLEMTSFRGRPPVAVPLCQCISQSSGTVSLCCIHSYHSSLTIGHPHLRPHLLAAIVHDGPSRLSSVSIRSLRVSYHMMIAASTFTVFTFFVSPSCPHRIPHSLWSALSLFVRCFVRELFLSFAPLLYFSSTLRARLLDHRVTF